MSERIAWCVVALLAALVLTSPVACTVNQHRQITEAIKAGADPLEARCAIEAGGGHGASAVCITLAARKGAK